jgi:hypothetical protein
MNGIKTVRRIFLAAVMALTLILSACTPEGTDQVIHDGSCLMQGRNDCLGK